MEFSPGFLERLKKAEEVIQGHNLYPELIQNNYFGDTDSISERLVGIFTKQDSHLVGIIDADRNLCICTDVKYDSRLEILFQDLMEILYDIENYKASMQDYK